MLETYSAKEVAKHNSSKSLWVIFNDKVYDITGFAPDHPGGDDIILEYAGTDITAVMADEILHDHSESAYEILEDNCIGILKDSELANFGENHTRRLEGQRAALHRRRIDLLEKEVEYNTYTNKDFKPIETDTTLDVKTHDFLDLNKPLVPQFFSKKFTKAHYLEQVHKPRYLNRPADFFGYSLLEPLSKTVWYVVPIIWLPFVAWNIRKALDYVSPTLTVVLFAFGIFIWTLLEYGLHRFLFHYDDRMPDNQLMFLLHFVLHGFHHYLPMDRLRLVVPPTLFVALATPWIKLAHFLFPPSLAYGIVAGAMFGYICYDMTHYYVHHAKVLQFHFTEMKKYHLAHHYKDFEAGYGITSKLWDYVFNTVLTYN